ncbi:hypothetical protein OPAG_09048 [Rhodococcus opacus PD630]|nr:hypothetical protein OPAG_09048 [Rhodococcus opacus PD630]
MPGRFPVAAVTLVRGRSAGTGNNMKLASARRFSRRSARNGQVWPEWISPHPRTDPL